ESIRVLSSRHSSYSYPLYKASAARIIVENEVHDMQRDQLLSVEEAAARLGLRAVTVRCWAAARKITRVKLGRRVLIPASEIERFIDRATIPASDRYSR